MKEAKLMKKEAEEAKAEAEHAEVELEKVNARPKANKCFHCKFTCDTLPDMTDHINEAHNYRCSIGSWHCNTHKELQRHWTKVEVTELFCEFCGFEEYTCQRIF